MVSNGEGRGDRRRRHLRRPHSAGDLRGDGGQAEYDAHDADEFGGQRGHRASTFRRRSKTSPTACPSRTRTSAGWSIPVGAFVIPVAGAEPLVGPAACNRNVPMFDGYTRFDVRLAYVGQRHVEGQWL